MKTREQFAYKAFRSDDAMRAIPVNQDDIEFIVKEVQRLFPARKLRPKVKVINRSGPYGIRGDARLSSSTIRLFKDGHNLATLLHEIAHLLAPRTPGQHHNKDFYFTCDMLERELFSQDC